MCHKRTVIETSEWTKCSMSHCRSWARRPGNIQQSPHPQLNGSCARPSPPLCPTSPFLCLSLVLPYVFVDRMSSLTSSSSTSALPSLILLIAPPHHQPTVNPSPLPPSTSSKLPMTNPLSPSKTPNSNLTRRCRQLICRLVVPTLRPPPSNPIPFSQGEGVGSVLGSTDGIV
jgi:hypothetical protein